MANTVSASVGNASSIESLNIEGNSTLTESSSNLLSDFDSKSIKAKLNKSAKQEGIAGLIKAFASTIKDLVSSLSTMLDKFSDTLSAKKENVSAVRKQSQSAKKKAIKDSKQNIKNEKSSNTDKAKETAKTEQSVPATQALTVADKEEASTPSVAADTATKIDPKDGYSDDNLSVATNKQGAPEIYTEDGYTIKFEGSEQAWQIIDANGKINRIWGDPHVVESDGDKWDFKERSTFLFGNNKVTVETVPYGNGQTLSSGVTIYNGGSRVSVSGIDVNKPVFEALSKDGILDDALRDDGDIFILGKEENGDDQFILLKDVAEKFDEKFAKQVGVGDTNLIKKYLTEQQIKL